MSGFYTVINSSGSRLQFMPVTSSLRCIDLAGARVGNIYCDPFITSARQKITSRHRWTPTLLMLQNLERIFNQENGTPSKEKREKFLKQMYTIGSNRRARSKRKPQNNVPPTIIESEVDAEVDSKDKKTKPEELIGS
ncbi:hypothetical protein PIB30_073799 [Stylosanthes scabra]|uniref:Uncharacterized protein n=1 Tax=Stylosanthes scabra TaxID=79078 RepID=A0ABU6SQT1_9FABA|nr:hypothetical protein [Stylosanthes scabra]